MAYVVGGISVQHYNTIQKNVLNSKFSLDRLQPPTQWFGVAQLLWNLQCGNCLLFMECFSPPAETEAVLKATSWLDEVCIGFL